jgi:hypothetical protein
MSNLTQWFHASTDGLPTRDGRYAVRYFPEWHSRWLEWRDGSFWQEVPLGKPKRLNLKKWPYFCWRGLTEPAYREALRRRKD